MAKMQVQITDPEHAHCGQTGSATVCYYDIYHQGEGGPDLCYFKADDEQTACQLLSTQFIIIPQPLTPRQKAMDFLHHSFGSNTYGNMALTNPDGLDELIDECAANIQAGKHPFGFEFEGEGSPNE